MNLFSKSTQAALGKAREKLSSVEENVANLEAKRAEKLAQADIPEIQQLDHAIAAERSAAAVYADKIQALEAELRKEHRETVEQQKAAALVEYEKALRAETDAGVAVIEAFANVGKAFATYKALRDRPRPWSNTFPIGDAASYYSRPESLLGHLLGGFFLPAMPDHAFTEMPRRAPGIIEGIRASTDSRIASLRQEPIPRSALQPDEEAA